MEGEHDGDKLARGARSATFVGPRIKIDESQMRDDLKTLTKFAFCERYMVTEREYAMMTSPRPDVQERSTETFLEERRQAYERETEIEAKNEAKLVSRQCFIMPSTGRLIVLRDGEHKERGGGRIVLVNDPKKRKLLPTTGHVIACGEGTDFWMGKRVLFGQMSGTVICFAGFPMWIMLQVEEVMGEVTKEDAQLVEETLEPMI